MAVCTTVTDWIQTEISTEMEVWEDQQKEKCKKRKWYDPRGWFCWLVWVLVKVTRWVIEYVLTPIFTVVCRLVAGLLSILGDLLQFLGLLIKALFTWDKCTLQEAFAELGNAFATAVTLVGDALIRPIVDRVQTHRLRGYVKDKIAEKYGAQPDVVSALGDLFRVDYGVFGYRMTCNLYRMYVDSRTKTSAYGDVPNLLGLHNDPNIDFDLYALAGFDQGCAIFSGDGWYRPRHQTAVFPFASGGGLGDPDPPELEREHLDEYISSGGQGWRHFRIYASSQGNLDMRIDAAKEKGRQIGLILDFVQEDKEVTDPQFINYNRFPFNEGKSSTDADLFRAQNKDKCTEWNTDGRPWQKGQIDYLVCELDRTPKVDHLCCRVPDPSHTVTGSLDEALCDLCEPVAVNVFGFVDRTTRGLASNLIGTTDCPPPKEFGLIPTTPTPTNENDVNLNAANASGVSFIDDIPDEMRKYVLIHELGHYFGLCHVSGLDRIMVSGKEGQGHTFSVPAVGNALIHGGPRFIYTEAKRVWNFVIANFPLKCFIEEPEVPEGPGGPIIL